MRVLNLNLADDSDQLAENLELGGGHHAHRVFWV